MNHTMKFISGCLGTGDDEERSKVREAMRFAFHASHSIFERTWRLSVKLGQGCLSGCSFSTKPCFRLGWIGRCARLLERAHRLKSVSIAGGLHCLN